MKIEKFKPCLPSDKRRIVSYNNIIIRVLSGSGQAAAPSGRAANNARLAFETPSRCVPPRNRFSPYRADDFGCSKPPFPLFCASRTRRRLLRSADRAAGFFSRARVSSPAARFVFSARSKTNTVPPLSPCPAAAAARRRKQKK